MSAATGGAPAGSGRDLSRLPSLTGMRWIAALLVFLTHVSVAKPFDTPALNDFMSDYLSRAGFLGVGFFFVLSGFVLTWSAKEGDRPSAFYRRRLFKLYPNHAVTWLVGLLLMARAGAELTAAGTVPSLFLLQSWIPSLEVIGGTNGPSWSLACEVLFYLSFPVILPLVRRIRPERLWLWVGVMTAALFALPLIAQLLPGSPNSPWQPLSFWRYWFVYFLPAARLPEFVLGILLARIVRTGRWVAIGWPVAALLTVAGYALMITLPDAWGMAAPTALPVGLLIAAVAARDAAGVGTPFAGRTMVWLGEVSFAFYMVHFLVIQYGPLGLAATGSAGANTWSTPGALGVMGITLALSIGFGWALYRLVEVPVMRRWGRSTKAAATSRPAGTGPAPGTGSASAAPAPGSGPASTPAPVAGTGAAR
ncbi:acyltransferase family protein [Kitasatospora sp. NPDC057965]|uniref:acyltransferase family protein n=1 Tax=Kitasatospora sp. NPDC057965 TaxID=3346291 RepID=UPI0036D92559